MKKVFLLLLPILPLFISSCSSNDETSNNSRLESAYNKLKNGIVGTWVMDGYYRSETTSANLKLGWEEDLYWWQKEDEYRLTFTSDGKFIDNIGNNSTYLIYLDESKSVKYGNDNDNIYWPFSVGAIYIKFNGDLTPFYYNPYFAEIKNDGRLYLYNTISTLGGEGFPEYRYKKQ